jgi:cephalosporin-C deacetylase-like acetyl esterase
MLLRSALFAAGVLCAVLPARAADLYSYDPSVPLAPVLGTERAVAAGVVAQDVSFTSPTGHTVTGEVVRGTAKGSHPGILFVHWLAEGPTANHTEFEPDAIALARKGAVSVLIDTMWAAPGWFDTVGPDAAKDGAGVEAQVIDIRRALDLLLAQEGVDPRRIAYVAHDFGAMFGALMANADHRPAAWVLMAGVPSLAEWYRFGKAKHALPDYDGYARAMARYDIVGGLHALAGKPVLLQFAQKDYFIPQADADAFAAAVAGDKTVKTYDADHQLAVPAALADRDVWLAQHLF